LEVEDSMQITVETDKEMDKIILVVDSLVVEVFLGEEGTLTVGEMEVMEVKEVEDEVVEEVVAEDST